MLSTITGKEVVVFSMRHVMLALVRNEAGFLVLPDGAPAAKVVNKYIDGFADNLNKAERALEALGKLKSGSAMIQELLQTISPVELEAEMRSDIKDCSEAISQLTEMLEQTEPEQKTDSAMKFMQALVGMLGAIPRTSLKTPVNGKLPAGIPKEVMADLERQLGKGNFRVIDHGSMSLRDIALGNMPEGLKSMFGIEDIDNTDHAHNCSACEADNCPGREPGTVPAAEHSVEAAKATKH